MLITDGKEECGGDPAATAADLVHRGLDIQVNVVGFGLADEKTKRDMEKIAEITGGAFFDAQDRETLLEALQSPLSIPVKVFDPTGALVAKGKAGETIELPVGEYTVTAKVGMHRAVKKGVRVRNEALSEVALTMSTAD